MRNLWGRVRRERSEVRREVWRVERFEAFSIMALCRDVSEAFDAVGSGGSKEGGGSYTGLLL